MTAPHSLQWWRLRTGVKDLVQAGQAGTKLPSAQATTRCSCSRRLLGSPGRLVSNLSSRTINRLVSLAYLERSYQYSTFGIIRILYGRLSHSSTKVNSNLIFLAVDCPTLVRWLLLNAACQLDTCPPLSCGSE